MAEETTLDGRVFEVPEKLKSSAYINEEKYKEMYKRSVEDPEGFWAEQADEFITWFKKWDNVLEWDFKEPKIKWFEGAKLNACYNCLDRHLGTDNENKTAIIWEGNEPDETKKFTFKDLHDKVSRFGSVLKDLGVKKGDRVAIYMPMIPELTITMLACARIGAIHSIVFGGFSRRLPQRSYPRLRVQGAAHL